MLSCNAVHLVPCGHSGSTPGSGPFTVSWEWVPNGGRRDKAAGGSALGSRSPASDCGRTASLLHPLHMPGLCRAGPPGGVEDVLGAGGGTRVAQSEPCPIAQCCLQSSVMGEDYLLEAQLPQCQVVSRGLPVSRSPASEGSPRIRWVHESIYPNLRPSSHFKHSGSLYLTSTFLLICSPIKLPGFFLVADNRNPGTS